MRARGVLEGLNGKTEVISFQRATATRIFRKEGVVKSAPLYVCTRAWLRGVEFCIAEWYDSTPDL